MLTLTLSQQYSSVSYSRPWNKLEQPSRTDLLGFVLIATYQALQPLAMVDVEGVWTLQLGKVVVTPGQAADSLSQDQALPAIRALVEASKAGKHPAVANAYSSASVATEGTGAERKIRAMRATVVEDMEYLWRSYGHGNLESNGGYLISPTAQPGSGTAKASSSASDTGSASHSKRKRCTYVQQIMYSMSTYRQHHRSRGRDLECRALPVKLLRP